MSCYIQAAVSYSACGDTSSAAPLGFHCEPPTQIQVDATRHAPFFAMRDLALDHPAPHERLFNTLFRVVDTLLDEAQLSPAQRQRCALLVGSTSLDISLYQPIPEQAIWLPPSDNISQRLADHLQLSGLHFTINTACTASINALLYGSKLLQHGYEHVIVIGCEFYNQLTLHGFHSLDLISPSARLKAFSQQRDGLILGEGIGALLLSHTAPERPHLELLDGYSSCDSFSLTTTKEDGSHIAAVIDQALAYAGIQHAQIDLIKVHGTATSNNDLTEFNALSQRFHNTPIWALKPFIGHTLGACGVLELALMQQLIDQDSLPVPEHLSHEQVLMPFAPSQPGLRHYQHILLNHCGFGGNNAAVVVKVHAS